MPHRNDEIEAERMDQLRRDWEDDRASTETADTYIEALEHQVYTLSANRTLTEIFYTSFDGNDYVIRMGDDQAVKECTENLRGFGITNITARVAECSPFDIVGTPVRLVAKR